MDTRVAAPAAALMSAAAGATTATEDVAGSATNRGEASPRAAVSGVG